MKLFLIILTCKMIFRGRILNGFPQAVSGSGLANVSKNQQSGRTHQTIHMEAVKNERQ